jgi:hypothetical protein
VKDLKRRVPRLKVKSFLEIRGFVMCLGRVGEIGNGIRSNWNEKRETNQPCLVKNKR